MRKVLWALLLILLTSAATAEIKIINPPDMLITFDEIVKMQGKVSYPAELMVNNARFPANDDGSFLCGLVLQPGKNLAVVRCREEARTLRLLRLLTYPDMEMSYEGKKHWARGQIIYLSTLGMIEGYPDGNFYPGNPVTRGELATWLAKAKKLPVSALTADVFFDVPKEHWRAPYIKAVVDEGSLRPGSKELFGIDDPVTRREAAGLENVPVGEPERALTRAEAAVLVSRFSAAQAGVRSLSNFEEGYTADKFCGLNSAPEISSFTIEPREIPLNKMTTVKLRAAIAARGVFSSISKVKVNLSSIGGMPDAEMFDDGTGGDQVEGDGIYSLNISLEPKQSGESILAVTATDRLGWEGKKEATLLILE